VSFEPVGNRRTFQRLPGGGYVLDWVDEAVSVEVRFLRRSWHRLYGEADVKCEWASVASRALNHSISCADLELSSQAAREARAKYCERRAGGKPGEFDWIGLVDEACRRVIEVERTSTGAIVLDDAEDLVDRDFHVNGLSIPADGASGFVADGGGLKSLLLLHVLGTRAQAGARVLYLDWEWNAARHRARKRRLFGDERLDGLFYWKCQGDLAAELDRIRRFSDTHHVDLVGIDSVSLAAAGKLTDDDTARSFQRALAELPASICVAHIPKTQSGGDDRPIDKPFGSAFFHNYLRASWILKKQPGATDDVVTVGAFPSKQNDGPRQRAAGFEFIFAQDDRIHVRSVDLATVDGLAESLPIRQRMIRLLQRGAISIDAIAEELQAKKNTIEQALSRDKGKTFVRVPGNGTGYIGLVHSGGDMCH
jgi:hypothetical protein